NKVKELNPKTNDKNFYKNIGLIYVNNLIKCNQDHKNICTPEIFRMIESEINYQSLTTDGIYNSLFKNEDFIKLVKFNIDKIIEKKKKKIIIEKWMKK